MMECVAVHRLTKYLRSDMVNEAIGALKNYSFLEKLWVLKTRHTVFIFRTKNIVCVYNFRIEWFSVGSCRKMKLNENGHHRQPTLGNTKMATPQAELSHSITYFKC